MRSFFSWCRRYISLLGIFVVGFVVYTLFIQNNSVVRYMEYQNTIDSLTVEIKHATDTMEYYQMMNARLTNDPELMERVVREEYNMVRPGEDVYIFEN